MNGEEALCTVVVIAMPCQVEGGKKVEEQSDEKDMGMSYAAWMQTAQTLPVEKCGPLSTFLKLRQLWSHKTADWTGPQDNDRAITPSIRVKDQPKTFDEKVAQKVKDFYFYNAINRHKMTTLTPSYHAENYSPDDNRFDLRPFLFPATFEAQFEAIDEVVKACAPLSARGCSAPVAYAVRSACTHRTPAPVVVRQQTMPVPVATRCVPRAAPATTGSHELKLWGTSLSKELDSRYPVTLLVNDIVSELLDAPPQPLTAPELRKDLKPRLVTVILDSIAAEGSTQAGRVPASERAMLAVAFHNSEAWQQVCGAARRQCSASGVPHYLAARILESLRAFLGLPKLSEDCDSDGWAPPPEQPLHPIDDVPPLLSTRGRWQEEQLPAAFLQLNGSLQEPTTLLEQSESGPVSSGSLDWMQHTGCGELEHLHRSTLSDRPVKAVGRSVSDGQLPLNAPVPYRGPAYALAAVTPRGRYRAMGERRKQNLVVSHLTARVDVMERVSSWAAGVTEALAEKDYAVSVWANFANFMDSLDQGLVALTALVLGASFVARGFAIMKPLAVLGFSGGLAAHTCLVALHEGQGIAGAVSATVVGICGVVFAHRVYPLFVFFLGCLLGGGAAFLSRESLGLAGAPAALLGLVALVAAFTGLVMKHFRIFSWRLLTPLAGGAMAAASMRFWVVSTFANGTGAHWLDFTKVSINPADVVSDPLEVFFVIAWGIAACLGWYAQLIAVAASADPLALPDSVAFRLQQLEKFCPWVFDEGEEFSSKILPRRLAQESMPFLPKEDVEMDDLAKKPNYKPEAVLASMVFSVLLLNFFMLGKPLLFLGHVVLMAAAFQAFLTAGLMSYASPNRLLPGLSGSNSPLLRHFTHATFNILVLFCAIVGFLCMYASRFLAHKSQVDAGSWTGTLHVWTGYVTLALLFVMAFSGAVKMIAGLTSGNADDVAKFHSHLGKSLYGFAGICQLLGYFMPNLLPLWGSVLLSVVLVAGTSATIFFLNARSPEVVRRMKRFNVGEDLSWDPAREASLVLAKPTAYRHSFSSNATTRIESLRSITRNSSITSAAAGVMGQRGQVHTFDWDAVMEAFEIQERKATVSLYFTHWHRHTQSSMIAKAQADLEGSNNLVQFLSSALVTPGGEP
ncbi:QNS1 [Symbiodinium natans]|uniref:QNS1 protein n=1 Tax=Symbiodinium natans TaxID=878477 RepID=A0A812V667_9DINO|nr:QNS1 [Symbiodinium natans]